MDFFNDKPIFLIPTKIGKETQKTKYLMNKVKLPFFW